MSTITRRTILMLTLIVSLAVLIGTYPNLREHILFAMLAVAVPYIIKEYSHA